MSNMMSNTGQNSAPVPPGGLFPTPPLPRMKAPRKNDIMSRRNRWPARVWRFIRTWGPWALLVAFVLWTFGDPARLSAVITIIRTILQYAMILAFGILQFVAISWFMIRSQTVILLP